MTGRRAVSLTACVLLLVMAVLGFWEAYPFAILGLITLTRAWRERRVQRAKL